MDPSSQLHALIVGLTDIQTTQYLAAGACALWVWDWLLNIGDEITFVWSKPLFQWGQILYLLNRYLAGIILFFGCACLFKPIQTPQFCSVWAYWSLFSGMATVLFVQFVLIIRVGAVYGQARSIWTIVVVGCIAEVISIFAFGLRILRVSTWTQLSIPGTRIRACVPKTDFPTSRWEFWIIPLTYDFVLFLLVFIRGWDELTRRNKLTSSHILRLIVRDSSLVFLYTFLAQLAYIFLWRFGRSSLAVVPSEMGNAIDIVFATRMLLNLWARFYSTDPAIVSTRGAGYGRATFGMTTLRNSRRRNVYDTFWAMQDTVYDDITLQDTATRSE
ncbi:hypothetical protein AURDEDRAFT_111553 [Auricularia subglabra TFB-10046 SS5]|nr:hypothetical protein AURDEDRAFT_111553 [Auricularia subglabra TFB-10046 SS5]